MLACEGEEGSRIKTSENIAAELIRQCSGDRIPIRQSEINDLEDFNRMQEKLRLRLINYAANFAEKITEDLQKKTGYDRNAAIEKCRRKAGRKPKADTGIGEDALVLSARRRAQQKTEQQPAAEQSKTE